MALTWIAAGPLDFAQDEERPVGLDLDADFGVLDVFPQELRGDMGGQLEGGKPPAP
jgi:hypothetical protein